MKKIILLVCAITALCSCGGSGNQNEKKVREVVEAKLKTEMNDATVKKALEILERDEAFPKAPLQAGQEEENADGKEKRTIIN